MLGLKALTTRDVTSAKTRSIQDGAEWYLRRLNGGKGIRQFDETQLYRQPKYGDAPYSGFQNQVQPEKWNPNEWMSLAKSCGAQTVIRTSKHHDGYCLWPAESTAYHEKRDIVGRF
ncbi:unnamed protein product [Rotaria sp. Silwood2]|nr:unnamed protein product [Rotaria sp. Silwood2]CAF4370824.1 unnamed protein product [Rotaria sp. Silwood2]